MGCCSRCVDTCANRCSRNRTPCTRCATTRALAAALAIPGGCEVRRQRRTAVRSPSFIQARLQRDGLHLDCGRPLGLDKGEQHKVRVGLVALDQIEAELPEHRDPRRRPTLEAAGDLGDAEVPATAQQPVRLTEEVNVVSAHEREAEDGDVERGVRQRHVRNVARRHALVRWEQVEGVHALRHACRDLCVAASHIAHLPVNRLRSQPGDYLIDGTLWPALRLQAEATVVRLE
mmetsp:Transcript_27082/g.58393  ORF Transcript_27082/g.58393 Transcript_27082/m.58393 type:complete len:232 (+) Transcript_27082:252-947(+)